MERDFEKEFIELKQSEVPDLWDRIEAGLTPKPAVTSESAIPLEQKPGLKVRIYRWGLLAAACLGLLIILPVLSLTRSNSSSSGMSGAGGSASESMEVSIADEGFDMEAETASEPAENGGSEIQSAESIESEIQHAENSMNGYADTSTDAEAESDGAGAMEDSVSNSVMNSADASRGGAASAADSASDASDVSKDEMKELQTGKATDWNGILQEGQLLYEVKIEVSKIIESDSDNQTYIVGAVVLSPDEDGFLYEGAELTLLCNEETIYEFVSKPRKEIPLQTGRSYVVDLRYEGNGEFVVVKGYN